jgi:hypothetical protein
MTHQANLWRGSSLAILLGVPLTAVGVVAQQWVHAVSASSRGASAWSRPSAPAAVVEGCNRLAAQAPRDRTRVLRDGVQGGSGVTAGTLLGLSEANRKSEYALPAYQQCMARRGY